MKGSKLLGSWIVSCSLKCWYTASGEEFWSYGSPECRLYCLPSTRFLCSVYILVAFPLGKYWAIDRSGYTKGKLQFTVN